MIKDQLPNQNNLLGFVPAIVVDNLMEKIRKKEIRKIPERQTFNSVVMFADISGFTNLSEKLALKGFEGAELLAFALTRYMEFLVKSIGKSGGDIFKFAGDAMIIIWPPPQHNSDEELTTLCRQAIQSSLDIQSKLHEIKLVEDIKLSVKIGFGVGQVTILHVGGVFSRAEYLAAGDPLVEAFECEHLAPSGGYIIISENMYKRVMNYFEFEKIDSKGHGTENFYYIKKVKKDHMVRMKADALLLNTRIKPSDIEAIRSSLVSYIPAAVLPFIEIDEEKWSHELRRLSIMFCNLGIDLSDAQSTKGLDRIQLVIETVQRSVYKHQGSLNKLLMDDKGSTLMIIFGVYPMAHQDDPVRAVLSGIHLIKELKKINCSCSIGVATGVVFAGVVGTSGSRREFSVLGDKVNLSARFMQAACKEKDKKILVDETTKSLAENKIAFKFVMKQSVKGKTGEIPFFHPIDPDDDPEINIFPYNIRTHMFTPQKTEGVISGQCYEMIGKQMEKSLKSSLSFIEKFLKKPDHNVLLLITGSYGIGKSLFIRNLLDRTYKLSENLTWKYNEQTVILVNTLNSSTKALPFNGWRSVAQKILINLALRTKSLTENVMFKLLENEPDLLNNLSLAADILNLKLPKKDQAASFENSRAQENEHKIIKRILLKIFQSFLEELDKPLMQDSHLSGDSQKKTTVAPPEGNLRSPPLIVVLEDMQDYDNISWSFTKKLLRVLKKITIIASVRDKYCEIPPSFVKRTLEPNSKYKPNSNEISNGKKINLNGENIPIEDRLENWANNLEETCDPSGFFKVKLTGLSDEEARQFVNKLMQTKIGSSEKEHIIEHKSNDVDHSNNKGNSNIKKKEPILEEEDSQIIITKFLKSLNIRTEGKALDILQIIENLKKSDCIKTEGSQIIISNSLKKLFAIKQFLTIEPPLSRISVNNEILDRLETHAYLLMKAAAVIGEEFDLQMLMKVNPFQLSIPPEKLRISINYLEKTDFIEILNESENNVTYRFAHPFMREAIYNRMLFSQRRQLHRFVAEAMQANPFQNEFNEKTECEKLIYHWCLAENLDSVGQELENTQFSNKAKRSLIVKKISSLLSKSQHSLSIILKSGPLDKKSDHGLSWSSRFLVLNCKDLKYYYSESDFKKNSDFALGVISLKHIFKIFYLDEKETKKKFAFVIYTGSWQKKNKEMGVREFYFSSTDYATLENWTTYLEFLRAKAVYDDFISSFGKISFPLNNNDRYEDGKEKGLMISRINQALENNRSSYKSPTTKKKNTLSSSRSTIIKGMNKQIVLTTIQEVMASNANQENAKRLKERMMKFLMTSMKIYFSNIVEVGSSSNSSIVLGQTTQILRKHPFQIDEKLLEDGKLLNFKSNLSESLDLTPLKGSLEIIDDGKIDINGGSYTNKSKNSENHKSGEDHILMGDTNDNLIPDSLKIHSDVSLNELSLNKSKHNLEMITEVEETHSQNISLTVSHNLEALNKANISQKQNHLVNLEEKTKFVEEKNKFFEEIQKSDASLKIDSSLIQNISKQFISNIEENQKSDKEKKRKSDNYSIEDKPKSNYSYKEEKQKFENFPIEDKRKSDNSTKELKRKSDYSKVEEKKKIGNEAIENEGKYYKKEDRRKYNFEDKIKYDDHNIKNDNLNKIEDKRKSEAQLRSDLVKNYRSTLDDIEFDGISLPLKTDSGKPSAILTRQELNNLQITPSELKGLTSEEYLDQLGPFEMDEIQVRLEGNEKLHEENEGKSFEVLINEKVVVSKKPHKNDGNWKGYSNFNDKNFKDIQNFTEEKHVLPKTVISRNNHSLTGSSISNSNILVGKNSLPIKEKTENDKKNIWVGDNRENVEDEQENEEKERFNRIPKVLLRKEKQKPDEKKKEDEDFLKKLPFRIFPQIKPKPKPEENLNPNYGQINFYRKL